MFVVAVHTISDPPRFWEAAQTTPVPKGTRLHAVLPSVDGSKAICLWEGDSLDAVRDLVDKTVGDASENELFLVDGDNARGLPA